MLDAVQLSHTFDGAFALSVGGDGATDTLARGGWSAVIQDRVLVSLAVDGHLVTVVGLPEDAMWPDLLRGHIVKRLDLDVHAELPTVRDPLGDDSHGAPFGVRDLSQELASVLDVHVVNIQVKWLRGAVEARGIGVEVEFECRASACLDSPEGMPNPAALHPHLGIRSEELVVLKFDSKGEKFR